MKKTISLILACLITTMLTIPALAATPTAEDISLEIVGQNTNVNNPCKLVEVEYDLITGNPTLSDYYVVTEETQFKITNTSNNAALKCVVYMEAYTKQPAGTIIYAYDYDSDSDVPVDVSDKYLRRNTFYTLYSKKPYEGYVINAGGNMYWVADSCVNVWDPDVKYLAPGQSISVGIPAGEDNTIYKIGVRIYDPATNDSYSKWKFATINDQEAGIAAGTPFIDVKSDAYYRDAVVWAVEREITNGTSSNTFSPEQTCTDAQILTFLWRSLGCPKPSVSNPFTNVESGTWYSDALIWAYENGLISNTTFTDAPCTRSSTVTYMWKVAGAPVTGTASFSDVNMNAEYAQAVAWAVEMGVTNGTSATTFSPNDTCTRGQIVTFLYRNASVNS